MYCHLIDMCYWEKGQGIVTPFSPEIKKLENFNPLNFCSVNISSWCTLCMPFSFTGLLERSPCGALSVFTNRLSFYHSPHISSLMVFHIGLFPQFHHPYKRHAFRFHLYAATRGQYFPLLPRIALSHAASFLNEIWCKITLYWCGCTGYRA